MLISVNLVKTLSCGLVESICKQRRVALSERQETCSSKRAQDYQLFNFSSGPFQDFPEDLFQSAFFQPNFKSYMTSVLLSTGLSTSALLYLKLSFTLISDLVKELFKVAQFDLSLS